MRKSEEKLGGSYVVTVYRLYLDQFTEEDYLGIEPSSYRKRLLNILKKEIQWLSSQSKTLTSQELLSSTRIKYQRTNYKLSLPARILDDIGVCKLRAKYTLEKFSAEKDLRLDYERHNEVTFGERKTYEIYFNYSNWVKIVGVPDGVVDNLVLEFTITRDDRSLRYC
jgi:hypothetical protein